MTSKKGCTKNGFIFNLKSIEDRAKQNTVLALINILTFQSKPSSSTHQDEPLQKKISSDVDKEKLDVKSGGFEYSGKNIDALLNQALAGRERILGQSAHRSR